MPAPSPSPGRPRRSVLYLPGSNPRALDKARTLPADGLIFDLEDAVAPEAKEAARANVAAALSEGGYAPRELVLRVNGLDTVWGHADIAVAATLPIDAVLLPKVESADRVRLAASLLDALGAPPELSVWCMVETPLGVLRAAEIAGASPRLAALVLGTSDLTKDLNARETRDRLPLMTALGLVLLAARAYGCAVLDGVQLDLDRRRRVRRVLPAGARTGLRRQDADPSDADRAGQRSFRAERGRDRAGAPSRCRLHAGGCRRKGRDPP